MEHRVVCFGEMLWDNLPTGKSPGGAPMNVAIHLQHQGYAPVLVSSVGDDQLGEELLSFLEGNRVTTQWVQHDPAHKTGIVNANLKDRSEVTYEIVEQVAWDYINYQEDAAQMISQSEVLVYGSLATRGEVSRETLFRYLPLAKKKVFDLNLRPPFYTTEGVLALLEKATIVKMNEQELAQMCAWLQVAEGPLEDQMRTVLDKYTLDLVIVTRGEMGAAVLNHLKFLEHTGYAVQVEDTIGSGDAFLAAFLANYLQNTSLERALDQACLIGAYVATQAGATPTYEPQEVVRQLLKKRIS